MSTLTKFVSGNGNGLLDELFTGSFFDDYVTKSRATVPYDVIETDKSYIVELLLAGFNKEDFNIDIEDGNLIIEGERREVKDAKYNFKQSYFGEFKNKFVLPKEILIDEIDAEYVDGVLKITVPKDVESIKSKSIIVK